MSVRRLLKGKISLTEGGSLSGIINMLDLVKYRLAEIEMEAKALKDYVTAALEVVAALTTRIERLEWLTPRVGAIML